MQDLANRGSLLTTQPLAHFVAVDHQDSVVGRRRALLVFFLAETSPDRIGNGVLVRVPAFARMPVQPLPAPARLVASELGGIEARVRLEPPGRGHSGGVGETPLVQVETEPARED